MANINGLSHDDEGVIRKKKLHASLFNENLSKDTTSHWAVPLSITTYKEVVRQLFLETRIGHKVARKHKSGKRKS